MYNMCIHALNWQRNLSSTNYFPPFSTIANYIYCMNFQFVRILFTNNDFSATTNGARLDEKRNRCKQLRSISKSYGEVYFEHAFVRFCYVYFSIYFLAMLWWLILLRCCSNCQCRYCCYIFHKRIIGAPVLLLSATTEL